MSQISGRIDGNDFSAGRLFAQAPPVAIATEQQVLTGSRRYARRLLVTDLFIIALASLLPALFILGTPDLGSAGLTSVQQVALSGTMVSIAWMLSLVFFKTRAMGRVAVGMQEYKFLLYATAAVAGFISLVAVIFTSLELRLFVIVSLPAGLGLLLTTRWIWRRWLGRQAQRGFALSNVLIYGQAADIPHVVRQISRRSGPAYRVVGVLLDGASDEKFQQELATADPTLPVFGNEGPIEQQAYRLGADAVIVAGPLAGGTHALKELGWQLEKTSTKLIVVSALSNIASRRVRTSPVEGMPLLHVELAKFSGWRFGVKRAFDMLFATLALLALSPVFAAIALLIRLDGPGKVFFKQERAGANGLPFPMFKFRTMVQDAEAQLAVLEAQNEGAGPLFKIKDDPRVTRIGRLLRKHSLDELPQFFNVLRGDMSVVGPRPPLYKEVDAYQGHESRRLYLKPGVTGLWQVSGRSNLDWPESIRLDLYYAENWTAVSDLRIIWRTFKVMVKPDGAY